MITIIIAIAALIVGGGIGFLVFRLITGRKIDSANNRAEKIVSDAKSQSRELLIAAKDEALKKVLRTTSPNLLINNETFHQYLTEGIDIEYRKDGNIRGDKVYIVDFNDPNNNEFLAVNQFTVIENNNNKRPDIILFVNGLPLVVIELKNPTDENR